MHGECACENMGVCKGEEIVYEAGLWEERAGSGPVFNIKPLRSDGLNWVLS